jgi:hypothetical protein
MNEETNLESDQNQGSAPLPPEAFNRGDGTYDEEKANDKDFLRTKMDENMATGDNPDAPAEDIDEIQKKADKDQHIRKPGSQSTDSGKRHNNGRGGGK